MRSIITYTCDECKQRQATCHFVGSLSHKKQDKVVCGDCYQALADAEREFIETHCRYCLKPLTGAETFEKDEDKALFMCKTCADQYHRFYCDEFLLSELVCHQRADKEVRAWIKQKEDNEAQPESSQSL